MIKKKYMVPETVRVQPAWLHDVLGDPNIFYGLSGVTRKQQLSKKGTFAFDDDELDDEGKDNPWQGWGD